MQYTKTLYKTDTKGKVRFITVSAIDGELIQESGLVNGKSIIHKSLCTPKNIGKSNETTSVEQAVLEAESKIKSKRDEGYFDTPQEAEQEEVILPMLAKDYKKESHKIDWGNAYAQPKYDGMRCIYRGGEMISRKGKLITTLPHLQELDTNGLILDGELYAHGLSFQENMELIKKTRPESIKVKYVVYDTISDKPFVERYRDIVEVYTKYPNLIEIAPTHKVNSQDELDELHGENLKEGYEGTMVRWGDEPYKINGRSSNLLKYKDFQDIAATIIDVEPSEKNPKQGIFKCEYEGKIFGCGMKFPHAVREEFLRDKEYYIGQIAEVRFFEYSNDGIPRFPVAVGIRLDI